MPEPVVVGVLDRGSMGLRDYSRLLNIRSGIRKDSRLDTLKPYPRSTNGVGSKFRSKWTGVERSVFKVRDYFASTNRTPNFYVGAMNGDLCDSYLRLPRRNYFERWHHYGRSDGS